jgi:hypothetical protein
MGESTNGLEEREYRAPYRWGCGGGEGSHQEKECQTHDGRENKIGLNRY